MKFIFQLTDIQQQENIDIIPQNADDKERNNNHVESCHEQTDEYSNINIMRSIIEETIDYTSLQFLYEKDIELIDEFVAIILDVLLSKGETLYINGKQKPRKLVQSNLLKLRYENIEDVLMKYKEHGEKIKKNQRCILSMLYNSPMELNAKITNEVQVHNGYNNHDMVHIQFNN